MQEIHQFVVLILCLLDFANEFLFPLHFQGGESLQLPKLAMFRRLALKEPVLKALNLLFCDNKVHVKLIVFFDELAYLVLEGCGNLFGWEESLVVLGL